MSARPLRRSVRRLLLAMGRRSADAGHPHRSTRHATRVAALIAAVALVGSAPETARRLADRATITRDTRGVAHIVAETEEAAAYAFGFAMAEDHAAEIGRKYLGARGEAARHFGETFAARDLAMRRLRNREAAREALARVDGRFRAWLTAFAAGINAYTVAHRDRLPGWMPVVEPSDPLAMGRMGAVTAALSPPPDLVRKYPASPGSALAPGDPLDDTPGDDTEGSNAVALSGARTTLAVPLLLGNPHLRWSERYWEAHVRVTGAFDFYGSTLVGIPVLRAGFNAHLAYVQTNNAPDHEDIYALPLDPSRPDHYLFGGRARRIERRAVATEVRAPDGSLVTRTQEVASTHLGPVVHESPGRVFAVRALALEGWRHYEGFYHLWRTRSREAFERVLDRQLMVTSNFTYADTAGHVLYRWNAWLPKRADTAADYSLDVDPADPRRLWRGLHRSRELPRLLDPPGGHIQNANNAPWWTSLRDRLEPAGFPPYIEREPPSLRAQAILRHLEQRDRWSPDDLLAAKYDTRVMLADRIVDDLLAAARAVPGSSPGTPEVTLTPREGETLRAAADILAAWDRRVDAGSRGAVLFQRFWERYRAGRPRPFADDWSAERPVDTPRGLADPRAAVAHLVAAADDVRREHGEMAVAWGAVHRFRFGALDLPADGAPGAPLGVYRVVGFDPTAGGPRIAGHRGEPADGPQSPMAGTGDAWILLVQLSRPVRAWSVLAYGQSSDPASPHSGDQIRTFADHQLQPVWFTEAEIAQHAERTYRPQP